MVTMTKSTVNRITVTKAIVATNLTENPIIVKVNSKFNNNNKFNWKLNNNY